MELRMLANYNFGRFWKLWNLDSGWHEKSEDGDETLGLVVVKHSKIFRQQKRRLTFQEFWMKGAKCGVYFIQSCNQSQLLHVGACMIISLVRLWGLFTTWLYMYHRLRLVWTSPFVQQQFKVTHGNLCPHNDLIKYTAKWSCKREWFKFKYLKWQSCEFTKIPERSVHGGITENWVCSQIWNIIELARGFQNVFSHIDVNMVLKRVVKLQLRKHYIENSFSKHLLVDQLNCFLPLWAGYMSTMKIIKPPFCFFLDD